MTKQTVTSAEFQRQFGRYREIALREPVAITNHGRESLVLLSAEEYERLKKLDTREALRPWELSDAEIEELRTAEMSEERARLDDLMDE